MLEDFYRESAERSEKNKVEMVKILPMNSPMFNKNALFQSIYDIPKMDDLQLRSFVNVHYETIVNAVYDNTNKYSALDNLACFTNTRFLDALIDVLQNKHINRMLAIKFNNICYDYISYSGHTQAVSSRMMRISNIINSAEIPRLIGIGIRYDVASYLMMARYSSFDLAKCVRNVNYVLISRPKEEMKYDTVLKAFQIIYNDMADRDIWTRIFGYFMMDVVPMRVEQDKSTHWITNEVIENNSILNLVVLEILNTIPKSKIRSALINYSSLYYMANNGKPVRFSLRSLSNDYANINIVIELLRNDENILVP